MAHLYLCPNDVCERHMETQERQRSPQMQSRVWGDNYHCVDCGTYVTYVGPSRRVRTCVECGMRWNLNFRDKCPVCREGK